jgi:hypothetical protein
VTDLGVSPNRGFRHLFKTLARRAGIEAGLRDALVIALDRSPTATSMQTLAT